MKKVLILMCLTVLTFMMTTSVLAEGAIGIDFIPGGADMLGSGETGDTGFFNLANSNNQSGEFKSYFVALEGTVEDFKYGIDYGNGTEEFKAGDIVITNRKYDFNMSEYKIGARVINCERFKLDLMFSQLQIQLKNSDSEVNQNGTMLGCDLNVHISEKVSLNGSLGYSLFGASYEEDGIDYDPAFILALKGRLNYAVAEHLALSLGFRETWCRVTNYDINSNEGLWRGVGGFSMGVRYTY